MKFDYRKLLGKIREVCGTQGALAHKVGITPMTMSEKLNNKSSFKQNEIVEICSVLKIDHSEIGLYFFAI